ncbi:MAG TPA: formylglycine-generating enzyme family protein [Armatimonadota bacterium]|nr:formylglycine-generating enzyme family protein [Armatimonadota bacterium]
MTRLAALGMYLAYLLGPAVGDDADAPRPVKFSSGVKMVWLPGGTFTMGDAEGEVDEPPHEVRVDAFYMDQQVVNQKQYLALMGESPSGSVRPGYPAEQVRWSGAATYCNARSEAEGLEPCYDPETWECDFDADGYRLPTEAEWEYACRAGTDTAYSFGDDAAELEKHAWFRGNSDMRNHPVGKKKPNNWGLRDMHGNVWEWCNDFYAVDYYEQSPRENPRGPAEGDVKVVRGGSWDSAEAECRSAYRGNEDPGHAEECFGLDLYGFRCVRRGD